MTQPTQDPLLFTSDPGENGSDIPSTVEYTKETNVSVPTPATKPLDEQIDDIIRLGVELGTDDGQPYIKYTEAAVDDLEALITNAEKQAYSNVGTYAVDKGDSDLMDFIDDRIQELENL